MKIGYLLNTYPVTSGTFIRREIHALEALDVEVERYAVRRWNQDLVDPMDRAEQARTHYLLSGRTAALIADVLREALTNPFGLARALATSARLVGNAGGGLIRHMAYLMEAASLKRRAKADGIAHIHAHFSTNSAAVALLCHRFGGPTYSFTAHGPDEFVDPGPSSLGLKIRHAAFVVAISHFCRRTLLLAGGSGAADKIHIVRCGLDLDEFPVSEAGFDRSQPLLCIGRLCPQKAQTLIPAAVDSLRAAHPDLTVVLIGDGESRAEIEQAIDQHGLSDRIQLLGWQSNSEVRAHLASARAMLLPSLAEGLPIVIMEALAMGRPVISTYIAGIPELVDARCGWIIPASAEGALAGAIDAAMRASPEILAEMGREGRARVERIHDQSANAAKLKALFAGVTGA